MKRFFLSMFMFNAVVVSYGLSDLDSMRGAATFDTSKCKDCSEASVPFYECQHWNPGATDKDGNPLPPSSIDCKARACIEDIFYYSTCSPKGASEVSNCNMEFVFTVDLTQQVRVLAGGAADLPCGADAGRDPSTWPTIPGLPAPLEDTCYKIHKITGKCFIPSCPGNDVDEIDNAVIGPNVSWNRYVCVY